MNITVLYILPWVVLGLVVVWLVNRWAPQDENDDVDDDHQYNVD